MVTVDDVAKVVLDRLAAVSGQATTCPGGHWFGRGPDAPAGYPYDVFQIEAQSAVLSSGNLYDQTFTVRLAGYCPIGDTGVDPNAVQQLFASALLTVSANTALRSATLRNTNDKVLAGRPSSAKGEYAPTLRQGKDVFICGLTAEIVVQGDRSAA